MAKDSIRRLEATPDHELIVDWASGKSTRHDFKSEVAKNEWMAPLRDPAVFARVELRQNGKIVVWPDHNIDVSASGLLEDCQPRPAEATFMSAAAMAAWLDEMDMKVHEAADAIGVSKRMFMYYLSGSHEIPKAVFLACMHLASKRAKHHQMAEAISDMRVAFALVSATDFTYVANTFAVRTDWIRSSNDGSHPTTRTDLTKESVFA